jgi:threonine dehydratase
MMPRNTPQTKVDSVRWFGARVFLTGDSYDETAEEALHFSSQNGAVLVHAFETPEVIAGQGTIALEFLREVGHLDILICPVGGGGLALGMVTWLRTRHPHVRVVGVESASYASMYAAYESGLPVEVCGGLTYADGTAVRKASPEMVQRLMQAGVEIVRVPESAVRDGMTCLLLDEKVVVEGAAALPIAALLTRALDTERHDRIGVVLTGSNVDRKRVQLLLSPDSEEVSV